MTVVAPELLSSISSEAVTFPLSVETLKTIKNIVVGNPRAKLKVLEDSKLLTRYVILALSRAEASESVQAESLSSPRACVLGLSRVAVSSSYATPKSTLL